MKKTLISGILGLSVISGFLLLGSGDMAGKNITDLPEKLNRENLKVTNRMMSPRNNIQRKENSGSEYMLLGQSMFNADGANVYPSGGFTVSYPVYVEFDETNSKVTFTNIFRNFLDEVEAPIVMDWNQTDRLASIPTPAEFYDLDECVKLGEVDYGDGDVRIITLQAGNPYGIGYWNDVWDFEMKITSDGNVIIPQSGFAMVGNVYDDLFMCYYYNSFYEAIFDARLYRRTEGVAIFADRENLDFGETFVNTTATRTFRVVNSGTEQADFVVSSTNKAFIPAITSGFIAPGEFVDIEVTFNPSATGEADGSLIIDTEESSASIELSGSGRESLDYSSIVSEGYEYMHFATDNEYPFVINTELTGSPVAVSTNIGEGRTTSWLEVQINVEEGKRGILDWNGYFDPRWAVYDEFVITDNGNEIFATSKDEQYVSPIGSQIALVPGEHLLRFAYIKGSMLNPQDVVLGNDYTYISNMSLTMSEYVEHQAELSSESYDFGTIYMNDGQQGTVTRNDVLTLRNTGYAELEITSIKSSNDNFVGYVAEKTVEPEEKTSISLGAYCDKFGILEGDVTITTNAGDFTIHCKADIKLTPDYQAIVSNGDFTFEVGSNPFIIVDGYAINNPDIPNNGTQVVSEFTAKCNVPNGKAGLLTWEGYYDCGDGDKAMIMIDMDVYGMGVYEGIGEAGPYTFRPYQCWLEPGEHYISFGYVQSGTSEWEGENSFAIKNLSLKIHDEMPKLVFWAETPVEFHPMYPGKYEKQIFKVYNMTSETLALLDVTAPDQFNVEFSKSQNSQVPQYMAAGFYISFAPETPGSYTGEVKAVTSIGDITIPVSGTCMDASDIIYEDDFENGIEGWTIIDANNDGKTWGEGGESYAYSGENCLNFNSFFTRITSEDYIVSPAITIPDTGGVLEYYRRYTKANGPQSYEVSIGTGDNPAEYKTVFKDDQLGNMHGHDLIKISLDEFKGETIHICFANFTEAGFQNVLVIDDVVVKGNRSEGVTMTHGEEIVAREMFGIDGMPLSEPCRGIVIIRETMGDGSIRIRKILN